MAHKVINDYQIFPRIMMLTVTILTYQAVHWFMKLPDPSIAQSGLVSVCMGALTGCFDIYRCEQFATAIEKTANSTFVGNRVFYENKDSLTEAKCLPQFVPQKTKFWD